MHFFTALVSTLAFTLPLAAVASPIQESEDVAWAELSKIEARGELTARQGITCTAGGNGACILKCQALRGVGGYCDSRNVCTCFRQPTV